MFWDSDGDGLRLAGVEVDAFEGDEGVFGKVAVLRLCWTAEVDLRDFVAGDAAGVLDGEIDGDVTVWSRAKVQIGVFEGGVAETETEGEERFDLFFVEPAITDVDPF
jgi:hypothetical protein